MEKSFTRNSLFSAIIILFVGAGAVSALDVNLVNESSPTNLANWLYVGGSEPGNYTTIQSAIDAASSGDTIFVFDDSSPYYENINISKSINLIGENKETTVIDGKKSGQVVNITESSVSISSFTIINSSSGFSDDAGIKVFENKNSVTISNCIITNNFKGIYTDIIVVEDISIVDCEITNNSDGIWIWTSKNMLIQHNTISGNSGRGIFIADTEGAIQNNNISYNGIGETYNCGIMLERSKKGLSIKNNNIVSNNAYGILIIKSSKNVITENNFIENKNSAYFLGACLQNKWSKNYWDAPRSLPKFIKGNIGPIYTIIPWLNFDLQPAKQPYDID